MENPKTRYQILIRAAQMPSSCWGRYVRIGVVEVDPSALPTGCSEPAFLSIRARGVVRVVETWERCHVGKTARAADARAVAEARALVATLEQG